VSKVDILKANGTYNRRHEYVKEPKFSEDGFYDPRDIVQVKYEMLRDVQYSDRPIGAVSGAFGFSRTAYYNIRESFENEGMSALIPEKPGPKQPHKLTGALEGYIEEYIAMRPNASAAEIAAAIKSEKGVQISKRTIERHAAKKKLL
jgi:transposase